MDLASAEDVYAEAKRRNWHDPEHHALVYQTLRILRETAGLGLDEERIASIASSVALVVYESYRKDSSA